MCLGETGVVQQASLAVPDAVSASEAVSERSPSGEEGNVGGFFRELARGAEWLPWILPLSSQKCFAWEGVTLRTSSLQQQHREEDDDIEGDRSSFAGELLEALRNLVECADIPAAPRIQNEVCAHDADKGLQGLRDIQLPPGRYTVTIFDWDDTLLCTTWLNWRCGDDGRVPRRARGCLRDAARLARQLLEAALAAGTALIVTNAQTGWVEESAQLWAPELLPLLGEIPIISARDCFQEDYPFHQWKTQAFLEVHRELDLGAAAANLVVLGDAQFEMDAAHAMGKQFEEAFVKTVKFAHEPTPWEHRHELKQASYHFDGILDAQRSMSLFLGGPGSSLN